MAFELADLVVAGFLHHNRAMCVHGRLLLRGSELPVMVELTGDPGVDLRGRSFEFEVPQNDRPATEDDRVRIKRFRDRQIGVVGEMTAARNPAAEDRPANAKGSQCLYLEWFSQNGRVVLELWDASWRFFDKDHNEGSAKEGDLDIDALLADEEADEDAEPFSQGDFEVPPAPARPEEDEGYGLIPQELNQELELTAHRIDYEIAAGSDEAAQEMRECELMDDLIERNEGTPIGEFLEKLHLPEPGAGLTEAQATQALRTALAELALFGVAFDVCEHYAVGDAYRAFMEQICVDCTVFPEMRGTGWVQHVSTSDFCPRCMAEFE